MSTDIPTPAARAARSIGACRLAATVEPWEIGRCVDDTAPAGEVQAELVKLAAAVRVLPAGDIPTPNPRPVRLDWTDEESRVFNAVTKALAARKRFAALSDRTAVTAAVIAALDLPARDARIRAETLRAAYAKVEELIGAYPLPIACAAGIDGEFHTWAFDQFEREEAGNPAESVAAGSAVPVEGSGLAAMFRTAAAGRREYAKCAPARGREVLEIEAATLDCAAMVAGGDDSPMYGWLPARMYTDEMHTRLDAIERAEGSGHPQPATARLLDLAQRMDDRSRDGDNPSDCRAMADFADELRLLAADTPEGDTANDH